MDGVVRDDDPISQDEAAALFDPLTPCAAPVLAVSGGPDSTALLWLMARWRDGLTRAPKLVAVTVDHGLRAESAGEARAVGELAARLGVEHHTLSWSGRKPTTGIQAAAREARYRLLLTAVGKWGDGVLLTGHTLDDQAETVLFRMMRGSGVDGLGGMEPVGPVPVSEAPDVALIRPLLTFPKSRLIATLQAANVPYAADPSNEDPRFARPRLRTLMPLLAAEGLTAERLGLLATRMRRVEDALSEFVDQAQLGFGLGPRTKGRVILDAELFFALPGEIALRLLQRIVNTLGDEGPAELGQLETLVAQLERAGLGILERGAADPIRRTIAGALVTLSGKKITVERAPPRRTGAKSSNHRGKAAFTKPR